MSDQSDKSKAAAGLVLELIGQELGRDREALAGKSWPELRREIEDQAAGLEEKNAALALDGPSQAWLAYSAIILALYRRLAPLAGGRGRLLALLGGIMTGELKGRLMQYLADRFGISQESPERAFEAISRDFLRLGRERFGLAWSYEPDVLDEDRCFVNVERCFFHNFFGANGAPELTPLFCALDDVWAEELNRPGYGVRFQRPETLAQGGRVCRFQFFRLT